MHRRCNSAIRARAWAILTNTASKARKKKVVDKDESLGTIGEHSGTREPRFLPRREPSPTLARPPAPTTSSSSKNGRQRASLADTATVSHYYCPTAPHTAASWLVHSGIFAVRALQCRLTRWEKHCRILKDDSPLETIYVHICLLSNCRLSCDLKRLAR